MLDTQLRDFAMQEQNLAASYRNQISVIEINAGFKQSSVQREPGILKRP